MEGRESSMALPDDIVMKIIAMVPFPFIFKARALSKSWQARFSQISAIEDEETKRLAISFQQQVRGWSGNWNPSCPLYWCGQEGLAYDGAARNWRRMPPLSFLQHAFNGARTQVQGAVLNRAKVQMEGALVLLFHWPGVEGDEMYVGNVLTHSWKRLPMRPPPGPPFRRDWAPFVTKLVHGPGIEGYNVVLLYALRNANHLAQIYDSKSDTWSCKNFVLPDKYWTISSHCVYLDGVLYMAKQVNPSRVVVAFNVKEKTWEELRMPSIDMKLADLVVCEGSLWIVTYDETFCSEGVNLLKVNLAGRYLKVSDGPPAALKGSQIASRPVSDGRRIFWKLSNDNFLEYYVGGDAWSMLPFHGDTNFEWHGSPFLPGLNPFVAV